MKADIINIGDEILIGQILNTNAQFIAESLDEIGFKVRKMFSISDDAQEIIESLDESLAHSNLVILTGGLGPTKDDLTKLTLADYFETELVFSQEVFDHVERLFKSLGKDEVPKASYGQAEIPKAAIALKNNYGTAPGMWFDKAGQVVVSLPGVPYEMSHLMRDEVIPRLKVLFNTMYNYHRTVLTTGLGESSLMEIIADWEASLKTSDIKLAYLPSPGRVRLRLSARGDNRDQLEEKINNKVDELYGLIPELIFGEEHIDLPETLGEMLRERSKTLVTAESCTGGNIAHEITLVAGSSDYFLGAFVTYSNDLKKRVLGVKGTTLKDHGAVSEQTVVEMALGAVEATDADYALAVSGIAGPGGASDEKPVGTVWIALAAKDGSLEAHKFNFGKLREQNIKKSTNAALNILRLHLLKQK